MSLLAILASSAGQPTGGGGLPYTLPLAAPYNVDTTLKITTPFGDNQTVHPDVVDFGAPWNGYRYWLGITPFTEGDPRHENPCVYASHDGWEWVTPPGLTNPIELGSGAIYDSNSDTDLLYDPTNNRLILTWRRYHTGLKTERIRMSHSTNGTTWSTPVEILATNGVTDGTNSVQQTTSQSIVWASDTDWRMWACGASNLPDTMRTATSPYGPWSAPQTIVFTGATNPRHPGTVLQPYHADVIEGPDGRFWMIGGADGFFFPAVSADGIAWTSGATCLTGRAGKWDAGPYRATMQPHENGTHMRVWYSAVYDPRGEVPPGHFSNQQWRTGLTLIPRSHWTSL
ncbi:hypothetical protein M3G03_09940 [Aestuariimicrobium sp. p3-SID1156]|uniref:hypothetical protein n=1 Tax=Aestuariimicrobium sp. p3-SID1156 TaxID=2916038 RepID=UPI00223B879E|nr:hypothetical protein [Aestuariimicrobium sp. p3-SID1156]MCT1459850.1 hypothetical protein [Aestuariimicrobium sp. p3-SID1156]